ncbi:MAG: hypothetical protein HOI47_29645 [Candidatus Scalindua sp.]|jgi:hypothetical protein|nr:hypothetical protein [Candidatus Scalindua sp.]
MNKKEERQMARVIALNKKLKEELLKFEVKYSFALDMLIAFGKLAGVDNNKKELDERFDEMLDNFDIDEENEVLINKRLRH